VDVTDATFTADVLRSEMPVVVDFWAPSCRPCRAVEAILRDLVAERHGRIRLVRLNVDENLTTPARYGVLSLPTVLVFAGGEVRAELIGPQPRRRYEEALAAHVA
jgi:thioredoxin 1